MSRQDLDNMCDLLTQRGFKVIDSYYSERTAGDWYLVVAGQPPLRVTWDGREQQFYVLVQTDQKYDGFPLWRELWVGRGREAGYPEFLVSKLQEFSRA